MAILATNDQLRSHIGFPLDGGSRQIDSSIILELHLRLASKKWIYFMELENAHLKFW